MIGGIEVACGDRNLLFLGSSGGLKYSLQERIADHASSKS
jgi:hypothetical protein